LFFDVGILKKIGECAENRTRLGFQAHLEKLNDYGTNRILVRRNPFSVGARTSQLCNALENAMIRKIIGNARTRLLFRDEDITRAPNGLKRK